MITKIAGEVLLVSPGRPCILLGQQYCRRRARGCAVGQICTIWALFVGGMQAGAANGRGCGALRAACVCAGVRVCAWVCVGVRVSSGSAALWLCGPLARRPSGSALSGSALSALSGSAAL